MSRFFIFILNFPWTLLGLFLALVSMPVGVRFYAVPLAIIIETKNFWWRISKKARRLIYGITVGHVIILRKGENLPTYLLSHELVHVEQYRRYPLVFPFMYGYELLRSGYALNRFEKEAYEQTEGPAYGERLRSIGY